MRVVATFFMTHIGFLSILLRVHMIAVLEIDRQLVSNATDYSKPSNRQCDRQIIYRMSIYASFHVDTADNAHFKSAFPIAYKVLNRQGI